MRPTSTEQTLNAWTLETGRNTRPFNFNNVKIILIVGSISDVKIDKPESGSTFQNSWTRSRSAKGLADKYFSSKPLFKHISQKDDASSTSEGH